MMKDTGTGNYLPLEAIMDPGAYVLDHLQTTEVSLGRHVACCIFHKENAPSLSISLHKSAFHCFGCRANGTLDQLAAEIARIKYSGEPR